MVYDKCIFATTIVLDTKAVLPLLIKVTQGCKIVPCKKQHAIRQILMVFFVSHINKKKFNFYVNDQMQQNKKKEKWKFIK